MRLRTRVLTGGIVLVLVPLTVLVLTLRTHTANRLVEQYTHRIDTLVSVLDADLDDQSSRLRARLRALGRDLGADNALRHALDADESAVIAWAPAALEVAGLDALRLEDADGRILSSGHFRNDWGRVDTLTARYLMAHPADLALVRFQRPDGSFLAFAAADTVRVGGRHLTLVAGFEVDRARLAGLAPDDDLTVTLLHANGALSPDAALEERIGANGSAAIRGLREAGAHLVRERPVAAPPGVRVGPGTSHDGSAVLIVTHALAPMHALLRGLDARLAAAVLLAAIGTTLLAWRLSASIARPLETLAGKTRGLDLDRLDVDFATRRADEVGTLSRFLQEMTARLRASVSRVREAERRAAVGELARQVNHDLRNAFTPLRNVIRHLSEVADESPDELARVYSERQPTLDAGLQYLDDLAGNWGKLSGRDPRQPCDIAAILKDVTAGRQRADGGPIVLELASGLPAVRATPIGLRRILENLVTNACDSVESEGTEVRVSASATPDGSALEVIVSDDGAGIAPELQDRIFDPFFTTRADGSGLGLAIARRLVSDFEGSIRVAKSASGGAEFVITLPAMEERP